MGIFKSLTGGMKAKVIASIIALPVIVTSGIGMGFANDLAFNKYSAALTTYLCPTQSNDGANAVVPGMGDELAVELEREGIVLLKNDGLLPLSKDEVTKVNVFGHGSVDWYIMSSGSEMVGTKGHEAYDFVSGLQKKGIEVNTEIQDYYTSWRKADGDGNTIMANYDSYYQIREPSLERIAKYKEVYERAKEYSDTAFFVISRHAGENSDCPHYQNKIGDNGSSTNKDETRTYLEISTEEEYTIKQLVKDFENVIIIVNSTNTMVLDFVDEIEGIDACLSVGVTGGQGALAIPEIVWGEYSPSGHLTDTMPYSPEYNITYFRSCAKHTRHYTGSESSKFFSTAGRGSGGGAFYQFAVYSEYAEGIYVGYRWFETADAEGFWDSPKYGGYENVVQYPFGYGLSYTSFEWELKDCNVPDGSSIGPNEKLEFTVTVKNTGTVAGKDVVQVYLTAPYTPGGIEKSSVKLVGFAKSPELQPGQVSDVKIEVRTSDFKSYDDYDANNNGFTGYELEKGNYEIKFMTDAHNLKEEMNKNVVNYKVTNDVQIREDEVTGREVRNLFTGEDAYEGMPIDGSSVEQGVEYVHRNNFPPLLENVEPDKEYNELLKVRASAEKPVTNYSFSREMGDNWDNATGYDVLGDPIPDTEITWGSGGDYRLIVDGKLTDEGMICGADYNDPLWEDVLDQVKFENAKRIVTMNSNYAARGIAEIGLRTDSDSAFVHAEGAAMVGGGLGQNSDINCPAYPGPTMICQAWNRVLTYNFGKSEGNDMNSSNKDALYSPNCNIHRSPYGGRNCGYQSEDPYLSGCYVSDVTKGIGVYGHTTFVKHFVCNDQDFNRMSLHTWLTEQAFREIYLRPFEEAVKVGDTTGIMTSFNRVGGLWAGGNEAIIQGVLRREWGFNGQIITDMVENSTNMDVGFHLRAGGNIILGGNGDNTAAAKIGTETTTPIRLQHRIREAIHQIAYSYTHNLYKNETYNASADPQDAVVSYESKKSWQWWQPAVVSLDAFVYGGLVIGGSACVMTLLKVFKKKDPEA